MDQEHPERVIAAWKAMRVIAAESVPCLGVDWALDRPWMRRVPEFICARLTAEKPGWRNWQTRQT